MNKINFILACLILSPLLFTISVIPATADSNLLQIQAIQSAKNLFIESNPINITNNNQLAIQASSGTGSSTSPYIIENIIISNCNSNITGISIQNTNKFFILKNITISYCKMDFYFNNVTFGNITNSYVASNNGTGYELLNSSNNNLINNIVTNNNGTGFELLNSSNNNLINNIVTNNTYYSSFFLSFSNYNTLISNTANNNTLSGSFQLFSSNDNTLKNNRDNSNTYGGFTLDSSNNNTLISNTADNNTYINFLLRNSSYNNTLVNNTSAYNDGKGFEIYSSNNTLMNNTAMNNTGDGFYIGFCSNNTLTNNIAKNNGGVGFLLYHSDKNTLADDIASNNSEGFWLIYSSDNTIINTTAMNNRFHNYTTGYSSFGSPTNAFISAFTNENLGTLTLLAMSFLIMVGMFIFLHSRKKQANSSLKTGKTTIYEKTHTSSILRHNNTSSDQFTKILPTINASKAMVLVEDILKESYQVPDYETAVKIQQGGFPDYGTYKQALDKDIPTYAEWLNYQKEHIKRVL